MRGIGLSLLLVMLLPHSLPAQAVNPAAKIVGGGRVVYGTAITSSGAWTVTSDQPWIWCSRNSGTGAAQIDVLVEANATGAERSGNLTIAGATQIITQLPADANRGDLWSMGLNTVGQLGDGTTASRSSPGEVTTRVANVTTGSDHSLFIKEDGTLWAMGENANGRLGDGSTTDRPNPVQVASGVASVSAGDAHTLFVKTDGTLWAMGLNTNGRLGDGTTTQRTTPILITTGVAMVSAGNSHSLFVKTDGTLWAMGLNTSGRLGDGTTTQRTTPVLIANDVATASAGGAHSLFVKTDGTLWAMGSNSSGQLGDGTTTGRLSPVQIATNVATASAGNSHSLFVKTDGTLWGMGLSSGGQLGVIPIASRSETPVQIASGVARAVAGENHSLFVKTDGTLWATGNNGNGRLGDGTTTNRTTPVQVGAGVRAIAAGGGHSLFVTRSDGTHVPPKLTPYLTWGAPATITDGTALDQTQLNAVNAVPGTFDYLPASGTVLSTVANSSSYTLRATFNPVRPDIYQTVLLTQSLTVMSVGIWPVVKTVGGGAATYVISKTNGGSAWTAVANVPWIWLSQSSSPSGGSTTVWIEPNLTGSTRTGTVTMAGVTHTVTQLAADPNLHDLITITGRQLAAQVRTVVTNGNTSLILGPDGTLWSISGVPIATGIATMATSGSHNMYVKTDGTLWTVGNNSSGELGDGTTTNRTTPVQVATGVMSVAAGSGHSLFLKTDGTLWAMGYNVLGQLGDGTTTNRSTPVQVASEVVSVTAGMQYSLYIKADGTLWGMGSNYTGQLGDGTTTNRPTAVQIAVGVAAAAGGAGHTLFLKTDGTLWGVGANNFGQLGDGTIVDRTAPVQIATGVTSLAAGTNHSLFVKSNGTLWAVGYNLDGQLGTDLNTRLGDGTQKYLSTPVQIATGVVKALAGGNTSQFLTRSDGSYVPPKIDPVVSWTWPSDIVEGTPLGATQLNAISQVEGSFAYTPAAGTILGTGTQYLRCLFTPLNPTVYNPVKLESRLFVLPGMIRPFARTVGGGQSRYILTIDVPSMAAWTAEASQPWVRLSQSTGIGGTKIEVRLAPNTTGATRTATVSIAGVIHVITQYPTDPNGHDLWGMGKNFSGQLGFPQNRSVPGFVIGNVQAVAAGAAHNLILKTDKTLWATGNNSYGQLGDGTISNRSEPVPVATGVVAVAAGTSHSLFVKMDGTLWAMGYNGSGQLGDGTTQYRSTPVQIATGVTAVATNDTHSLFVRSDGTLWAMGNNYDGQLGDGTNTQRLLPVQIATEVATVAAGDGHSLFVKRDGTLWAMGDNGRGQLGDGTIVRRNTPVLVASGVVEVAAGDELSLFIKTDGTLWAMGRNLFGEFGNGTTTGYSLPLQVANGVKTVAAGVAQTLYVKTDGTLWAAGRNDYGRLGDGGVSRAIRSSPVQVAAGVAMVSAGRDHNLFVKTDGTLWAMGDNSYGELGDGTNGSQLSPVQIANDVAEMAAGREHTLFVNSAAAWVTGDLGSHDVVRTPLRIQGLVEVASVATNSSSGDSAFLKTDGTFWVVNSVPTVEGVYVNINIKQTASSVAMGTRALFLKTDGTLWGDAGALVASGVRSVSSGQQHAVFLKTDDTLWGMGDNSFGQLGDGTKIRHDAPVLIASGVSAASAGAAHTLFVKIDGSLWGMGGNYHGELGDGTTYERLTPIQIAQGVVSASAGGWYSPTYAAYHSAFVKIDGTLWTMGRNDTGQLGDGTTVDRHIPVQVASGVIRAVAGGSHTLFTARTDGSQMAFKPFPAVTWTPSPSIPAGTALGASQLNATADVPGAFSYSPAAGAVLNAGSRTLTVTFTPSNLATYDSVTLARVVAVEKVTQTILFSPLADILLSAGSFNLTATASSGLPVTFELVSGPAELNGTALTPTGEGLVTIRARQEGNDSYLAATAVERSFTVTSAAVGFEQWRTQKFTAGELADALISGAGVDPDGDGLVNLLEYALALEPKVPSTSELPSVSVDASDWIYTYKRPVDRTDLTYLVEVSTNLSTWTTVGVTHERITEGAIETWRAKYPLASATVFFRLRVEQ